MKWCPDQRVVNPFRQDDFYKKKRVEGIEPSSLAWKAIALPLSYTRESAASKPRKPASRMPRKPASGMSRKPASGMSRE